ncbi:hypothetical protein BYT27DRAFT_7106309 [Phlegmacium glaucopus]|nr:hypothetical protein BYT27DRAFT_7106309 [Phlegmacium glaucopus]
MLSSDSLFLALPFRLQGLIDEAFDLTVDPNHTEYNKVKTRPFNNNTQTRNETGAGGFLVESHESHSNTSIEDGILDSQNNQSRSSLSLSSIPTALQLLDLPPDDPEVLSVFKNAASGWTSGSITSVEGLNLQEKYVSREDWRSVCAILLEHRKSEISSDDGHLPRMSKSRNWQDVESDSQGYIEPESGSDSAESSSDEYMEHHMSRRKRMQDQNRQFISRPPLQLDLEHPSSRQKETCLKTFALFFPEVPHHKLADHRIMIKDLQRVSKLLGEKFKAEEMVEMLSTFSTSPDKSVSFDDFSRIMIVAKLA